MANQAKWCTYCVHVTREREGERERKIHISTREMNAHNVLTQQKKTSIAKKEREEKKLATATATQNHSVFTHTLTHSH